MSVQSQLNTVDKALVGVCGCRGGYATAVVLWLCMGNQRWLWKRLFPCEVRDELHCSWKVIWSELNILVGNYPFKENFHMWNRIPDKK